MSNNVPDYKDNLVFEPDYSVYETARKLKRLEEERNLNMDLDGVGYLNFDNFCINLYTNKIRSNENLDFIVKAKSNKHLIDIVEVLTRG